jgi:hypothetical protein
LQERFAPDFPASGSDAFSAIAHSEPQRLKPALIWGGYGTTEQAAEKLHLPTKDDHRG